MKKLRIGIIGLGFVGAFHIDAIRRIGGAEIVAVADTNIDLARQKAEEFDIPGYYCSIDDMLAKNELNVVHNCTPNFLHRDINLKVIQHSIHLFSEKPLTRTVNEARDVMDALKVHPEIVAGVNHCYRMNPMVQEIRQMIADGSIGTPRLVHGSYLQDHLLYETDYNWRIDSEASGPSRAIADIGTHWMDIVQHVIGSRIIEVCADLVTVMPVRKKPRGHNATFSRNTSTEFDDIVIENEDYGSVLFKMENGMHGVFYVSQVSAGHGCGLCFEINGSKSSLSWNQEQPNQVWVGNKETPNQGLDRNPVALSERACAYSRLAKGHPEGWNDALHNCIASYYGYINHSNGHPDFATFEDAFYLLQLVEAILKSSTTGTWVKI